MTVNLNHPPIVTGQISAADVSGARQHSSGVIWQSPHRLLPAGCNGQGRYATRAERYEQWPDTTPSDYAPLPAEACSDLGADDCKPPASRTGIALVVLPWVLGVIGWAVWTRWPLF